MKVCKILIAALLSAVACTRVVPEEITQMNLARCLTPTNLSAELENDADVIFTWQVNKDAERFTFVYADNSDFEVPVEKTILPSEVPLKLTLAGNTEYYYKVQALSSGKEASKWAVCSKSIRTR